MFSIGRPVLTAATVLTCVLALSGCGGSDADNGASGAKPAPASTPVEVLATAKKTLDATSGVSFGLKATDVPEDVTGLLSGSGTLTDAPAFDGSITVQFSGLKPQVPIIAVDGKVYAQLPLTTGWQTIDPAEYGAPDPATLIADDGGISDWLTATTGPTKGDTVRGGAGNREILTEYTGTLPADSAKLLVPSIASDMAVTYTITDDFEVREITLRGDVYGTGDTETYTVTLQNYGRTATISAPN